MNKHSIGGKNNTNNYKHILRVMRITVFMFFFSIMFSHAATSHSQEIALSLHLKSTTIKEACKEIEKQTGLVFVFADNAEEAAVRKVNIRANSQTISNILDDLLSNSGLKYKILDKQVVVYKEDRKIDALAIKDVILGEIVQQQKKTITGNITDKNGAPIIGANIVEKGTTNGTITDVDGNFTLTVDESASLQISYIGYLSQEIKIAGKAKIDLTLIEDLKGLEEVVVVGYGTQKKVTLTGAISAITSENIVTTKNENVQNALTGKIPGLRVVQKTSEPGVFSNAFDIRGFGAPLIIIDGVSRSNIARLDPNDIESISILKDASAAIYGIRAANGVVLVTTKSGKSGAPELQYSAYTGWQRPSGLPKNVGAADWMELVNEKFLHSVTNESQPPYSQEQIDEYRNGTKQSVDWFPHVIQNTAPQTQHNLSISGGTDKINYFISMGYLYQEGFIKSKDLNFRKYNVRSNITAKITNNLKAALKISGIYDSRNQPSSGSITEVFKTLWRMDPVRPVYANDNPEYLTWLNESPNPVAIANSSMSGYTKDNTRWFQSSFDLTYDVPYIQGLSLKGQFSYDYRTISNKDYRKQYTVYEYSPVSETYKSYLYDSPSTVRREFTENPTSLLQGSINYSRTFNAKHNLSALLLYEEQLREGDNFYAMRELSIEGLDQLYAGNALNQIGNMGTGGLFKLVNKSYIGKLNYDFASKYITEFSFRYDGSSKFPKNKQWGFFPAASAGWRVSEENFMKNAESLSFIDNLKIRGSYGIMGDEDASTYQFISGYTYPANVGRNNNGLQGGYVFNGNFITAVDFKNLPNNNITWYEVATTNFGVDIDLWNGQLGTQVDVFKRKREGLLATRRLSLPGSLGAPLPQENMNSDEVRGIELSLSHRNRIGEVNYNLSGNVSYTRIRWLQFDQAEAGNSYRNWTDGVSNRYKDIWWANEYIGQFQTYDEIYNSNINYGGGNIGTLPGDYKYSDWNGDGIIDANDNHPVAISNGVPKIYYGFNISANYKGFDLDLLFQGTEMVNVQYTQQLARPLMYNGALEMFLDRWRPTDPTSDPYDPNTAWTKGYYAYTGTEASGTRAIQDASYLRLKSIEMGYTIPKRLVEKIGLKNLRIYSNGYNLLTFTKIQYLDPEHPSETNGYIYPLNKTINIGINATF